MKGETRIMDNHELTELLRRAARLSREGMEEGRFGMPPPPRGEGEDWGPRGPHGHGGPCCHGHRGMGPEEGRPGGPVERPHRERERVLSLLDETEGISQQKLALILGIRPQSLSELLGKLEKDGLLVREKNPEDRRETLVSLTPEGRERAASFEEERETLGALLTRLLDGQEEE